MKNNGLMRQGTMLKKKTISWNKEIVVESWKKVLQ